MPAFAVKASFEVIVVLHQESAVQSAGTDLHARRELELSTVTNFGEPPSLRAMPNCETSSLARIRSFRSVGTLIRTPLQQCRQTSSLFRIPVSDAAPSSSLGASLYVFPQPLLFNMSDLLPGVSDLANYCLAQNYLE